MSNLKILYIIAFATCLVPNTPNVKNVSYDEPLIDLTSYQEKVDKIEEGSCYLSKDEQETISLEELLNKKENKVYENIDDDDSGDRGDY